MAGFPSSSTCWMFETPALNRINPGEIYYLGVFMVGAFQDIMGDLHNLF